MQSSPSPEGEEFTDPLPGTPKTGECLHLIYGAVQFFIILHLCCKQESGALQTSRYRQ